MANKYNKSKRSHTSKKNKSNKKFKPHTKSSKRYHPPKINYWDRENKYKTETTRTIELNVIYSCCYDGIYNPEPIPLEFEETDVFEFSLPIWAEFYLNHAEQVNYITSLCNDKCKRVLGSGAQLCEDGYNIEVLDMYED